MAVIRNVRVYGIENAIRASKLPMAVDVDSVTSETTRTVQKLGTCKMSTGHDQFLTGCIAQFDLTFTVKAWTEAERYHFLDFISSQSTMHRISKFDLDKQYSEYVDDRVIKIMNELKDKYNETGDKEDYLRLLYTNPCGFKLTAAMTTNYRQLKTIYHQRKLHKLPEWREFCTEIVTKLPRFAELALGMYDTTISNNETVGN